MRIFSTALAAAGVLFALACAPAEVAISIPFEAAVGQDAWACGETYEGIGTSESTVTPKDFRVYIHDIQLDGEPVTLDDNDFQANGVALLDFEDGTGACEGSGDARTNLEVLGTAASATGDLSFKLGVPFDQNHQDVETAAAPLDIQPMFWNWNGGYKFVRADSTTTGLESFNFHLGSTGCEADEDGVVTGCANENRFQFAFTLGEGDTVTFDLAELLAESDIDVNTPETPPGCQSGPTDPECEPVFDNISNFALLR
jgi:uncharacterized repeat protein (TIGR04052 family)